MIRFPPTSIALSESDIDFHLREIQIKEQLYAQGFTREEVQRYYNERYGNAFGIEVDDDALSTQASSPFGARNWQESAQGAKAEALTGEKFRPADTTSVRTASSNENVKCVQTPSTTLPDPLSSSPTSMPSSPPGMQVHYRHAAVRQSSLLRIMHTAASQPSTTSNSSSVDNDLRHDSDERDESEAGHVDFLQSPATKKRSYRPRSKTYTYVESEADPPTPPGQPHCEQGSSPPAPRGRDQPDAVAFGSSAPSAKQWLSHMNSNLSPSWPEPETSSPLTLPPPLSIHRRTSSLQFRLPDRTRSSTPLTVNRHDGPHQSIPPNSPMNNDRVDNLIINHPPAVSPNPPTSHNDFTSLSSEDNANPRELTSFHYPSTPTRADTSPYLSSFPSSSRTPGGTAPKTEPRNPTRRHNDTFGVFNDQLPTEAQPQTPADLQSPRRRAVAERNMAYTAPPGQIRTVGRLVGVEHGGEQVEAQTPTVRAARLRERRAREFGRWRTARMESLREPETDDAEAETGMGVVTDGSITPGLAVRRSEGQDHDTEQREQRLVRGWAQFSRSRWPREVHWRDEFDEDRVGEENFEAPDLLERRGNAGRRRTTSEGEEVAVMARTPEA